MQPSAVENITQHKANNTQRWAQIHQNVFKNKNAKYCVDFFFLNTNTVFCILKIHIIHLKLAIQWSNTIKDCLHQER